MEEIKEMDQVMRLKDKMDARGEHPKFKKAMGNDNGEVLLVGIPADVEVPRHHVHCNVLVQVLEGELDFTIYGHPDREVRMHEGDFIEMQPDTEHSLRGVSAAKVLVTKINA